MKHLFIFLSLLTLSVTNQASAGSESLLCSNVDLSSRQQKLKPKATKNSAPISREVLSSLFVQLDEQQDPNLRMTILMQLESIGTYLPDNLEIYWTQTIKQHLYKETNVFITEEILKSLSTHKHPQMTSELEQYILCDRDEALRQIAIDIALQSSERWHLRTLTQLWKEHPLPAIRDKIRRFGLKMLALGADSYELLQTLGYPPSAEEVRTIYKANKASLSEPRADRFGILNRMAWLGGTESTAILKEDFEQETEPSKRKILAELVLVSQLEPDKPQYKISDDYDCTPKEDIATKRLPLVEKEVERLLDPANQKYYELTLSRNIPMPIGAVLEWGSSLKDPKDRIHFWERALSVLPENSKDLRSMPLEQLVYAHASYAGDLMLTDRDAAKKEVSIAETLSKDIRWSSLFPLVLKNMTRWIERKQDAPAVQASDLLGSYSRSFAYEFHKLMLQEDNLFKFQSEGDVVTLCGVSGSSSSGKFLIEGNHLLLVPGPDMARHRVNAPDIFTTVFWGNELFLLDDDSEQILELCNSMNSGRNEYVRSWWLSIYRKNGGLPSNELNEYPERSALPEEWQDCILDKPLEPEVIKVEEKSALVVNMGKDDGLRVGMKLYLDNSALGATWKISEVSAKQSHAVPIGDTPEIAIGEKLSTRIPD